MAQHKQPSTDARAKRIAAWAGVGLTAIAIIGLFAAPGARVVWVVLLVFGIATIPQVLFWRQRQAPSTPPAPPPP